MLSKGSRSSLAHLSQVPGVKLQVFPEATWVEVASLGWYLLGAVYRLTPHAVLQVESHQEAHSGDLVHTPDQRRPPGVDKDCVAAHKKTGAAKVGKAAVHMAAAPEIHMVAAAGVEV